MTVKVQLPALFDLAAGYSNPPSSGGLLTPDGLGTGLHGQKQLEAHTLSRDPLANAPVDKLPVLPCFASVANWRTLLLKCCSALAHCSG